MQKAPRLGGFRRVIASALALLVLLPLWNPARGEEGGSSRSAMQLMMLQQQILDIDREIDQAEAELRSMPSFSWACCCGYNLFFPIGTVIWLLTDVAQRREAKGALREKIERLESDKQNLKNQMLLLQPDK